MKEVLEEISLILHSSGGEWERNALIQGLSIIFKIDVGRGASVCIDCWLAAVGAGLLSEEILEGVAMLRISDGIEYEDENFIAMINKARENTAIFIVRLEKWAKLGVSVPAIPMEIRAEKALEAIYVCCFGRDPIEEEDVTHLPIMLNAVFPTVRLQEIERIVKEKAKRVAEGTDEIKISEPKPLPKEAVLLQMKDLQFLRE